MKQEEEEERKKMQLKRRRGLEEERAIMYVEKFRQTNRKVKRVVGTEWTRETNLIDAMPGRCG
jgi:hypothetical protein